MQVLDRFGQTAARPGRRVLQRRSGRADGQRLRASFAPWQDSSTDTNRYFQLGHDRTEYVTARPGPVWLHTLYGYETPDLVFGNPMRGPFHYWSPGDRARETWLSAPARMQWRTADYRLVIDRAVDGAMA